MSRPILQSSFFKKHSPKGDFFRRFRNHFKWNAQVLPVYEWEGLLYVATDMSDLLDSPPKDWPEHWVLIEASSSDLENLWNELSSTQTGIQAEPQTESKVMAEIPEISDVQEISSIPELPNLPEVASLPEIPIDEDAIPDLKHAVAKMAPPTEKPAPSLEDIFSGTSTTTKAPTPKTAEIDDLEALMSAADSSSSEEGKLPLDEAPSGEDMLEGLSASVGPIKLGRSNESPEQPSVKLEQVVSPIPETETLPELPEDTLPPIPRASIAKHQEKVLPLAKAEGDLQSESPPPPPALDELTPTPAPKVATSANAEVPNEERLILDQLPKVYHRSFLAIKAGNSLRIVSWPKSLEPELATKEKDFSFNPPSPFRIAMKTEKPYHGYLVQTPFMTQFMANWNGGNYPETFSVVPIRNENNLVGFILSLGTKEADKKAILQAVEKAAENIGKKWVKLAPGFTKAA